MHVKELFDLSGKTAIVTGGGRGLGEQIAEGFAEAGANIVLCSRKKENCDEVADRLKELGVEVLTFKCDITKCKQSSTKRFSVLERLIFLSIIVGQHGGLQ